MTPLLPHYLNGGEVHAGDRVRYKGASAKVLFVSDGDNGEFAPGYSDYLGHEAGIMLSEDEENAMIFVSEADEELELVARKPGV